VSALPKRRLLGLGLVVLGLHLATAAGHLFVQDEVGLYFMTASFVERGDFSVPRGVNTGGGFTGLDGRYYSPFGIGQPLLAAPLLGWIRLVLPAAAPPYLEVMLLSSFNQLVTAAAAALLALILLELGASFRRAAAVALCLAFATHVWTYGRTFFSEPLTMLLGLLALRSLLHARAGRSWHAAAAGLAAGASVLVRFYSAVLLPLYALYLLWPARRGEPGAGGAALRRTLLFCAAAGLFVLVALARNRLLLGSWLETGYQLLPTGEPRGFTHPIPRGLAVLLLAPGKGLFAFAPPVLLGLALWPRWLRERPPEALLVLGAALLYVVGYAAWCAPEAGNAWGPRFLVPIVPLLLLPLAAGAWSRRRSAALASLAALGLAVALLAVPVDFARRNGERVSEYYGPDGRYNLAFLPYADHLHEALRIAGKVSPTPETRGRSRNMLVPDWRGEPDLWFVHLLREGHPPGAVWLVLGLQLGLCGAGGALLLSGRRGRA
jgi:hypothetical protein